MKKVELNIEIERLGDLFSGNDERINKAIKYIKKLNSTDEQTNLAITLENLVKISNIQTKL